MIWDIILGLGYTNLGNILFSLKKYCFVSVTKILHFLYICVMCVEESTCVVKCVHSKLCMRLRGEI